MTSLAVHTTGDVAGTPLVLLHAFPLDSRMWEPVLPLLPGIPVVRVDAPGFGASPVREPGLEEFAHEVSTAVRGLGAERAVVVGLSMGGYVAMALAEVAPHLLAGLGLLSTKAGADAESARAARLTMADAADRGEHGLTAPMVEVLLGETTRLTRPTVHAQVQTWLAEAPFAGIAWAQRSMAHRPDRHEVLAALPTLPALVLRGVEDGLMSVADAADMAEALVVGVAQLDGVGHLAALEDPVAVAAAIGDLYARSVTG